MGGSSSSGYVDGVYSIRITYSEPGRAEAYTKEAELASKYCDIISDWIKWVEQPGTVFTLISNVLSQNHGDVTDLMNDIRGKWDKILNKTDKNLIIESNVSILASLAAGDEYLKSGDPADFRLYYEDTFKPLGVLTTAMREYSPHPMLMNAVAVNLKVVEICYEQIREKSLNDSAISIYSEKVKAQIEDSRDDLRNEYEKCNKLLETEIKIESPLFGQNWVFDHWNNVEFKEYMRNNFDPDGGPEYIRYHDNKRIQKYLETFYIPECKKRWASTKKYLDEYEKT